MISKVLENLPRGITHLMVVLGEVDTRAYGGLMEAVQAGKYSW